MLTCILVACDGSGIMRGDASADADADEEIPCESYTDSDGDTIADSVEGDFDLDGDTIPSFLDDDSDGDTVPDSVEAGDDDLCTPPVDSDGDHVPDFLDTDSDGDGLDDGEETDDLGTDPHDRDTDDDGYTDLVEEAAGSDPLDPTSTPDAWTLVAELPYLAPEHEYRTLSAGTDHRVADVYFLVDTNISMRDAIESLAFSFGSEVHPGFRSVIHDVHVGVGHFNDVPSSPYGGGENQPFWNVQTVIDDDDIVRDALRYLHGPDFPFGGYSDPPESQVIALWCAASGNGFTDCSSGVPRATCPADHSGQPCFRPGALPVIALVSDAPWHGDQLGLNAYDCTSTGFDDALEAMIEVGARFIGVHVGSEGDEGYASMEEMAVATGSVDLDGAGLAAAVDVSTVGTAIVDLFQTLATTTPMDVRMIPIDEPGYPPEGDYDATVFLKDATPISGFPDAPEGYESADMTFFHGTVPGTVLDFAVDLYNNTVPPLESDQLFRLRIVVLGNGVEHLRTWMVYVLVPTEPVGWDDP